MKKRNIKTSEAAEILGVSPQFVRTAMQLDRLPIGTAIKMSSQWSYQISRGLLEKYCGRDIGEELDSLRRDKNRCDVATERERG